MATPSFYVDLLSCYHVPGTEHVKTERLSESSAWEKEKNQSSSHSQAKHQNGTLNVEMGCAVLFERASEVIFSEEWYSWASWRLRRKVAGGKRAFGTEAYRKNGILQSWMWRVLCYSEVCWLVQQEWHRLGREPHWRWGVSGPPNSPEWESVLQQYAHVIWMLLEVWETLDCPIRRR